MPLSFISVSILREFDMLPDVYMLLSPKEEEVQMREQMYTSGNTFIKRIKPFVFHYISMP